MRADRQEPLQGPSPGSAVATFPRVPRRSRAGELTIALLAVSILLVGSFAADRNRALARAALAADGGAGPVVVARSAVAAVRTSAPPVALTVPAAGVSSRLVGLRTSRQGTLEVPTDFARAGWWSEGPAAGDPGAAIFVGHVDSFQGPAVFAGVARLKAGDPISVRRADGSTVAFRVTRVARFPKSGFPTAEVYRVDGPPVLRLITCGGAFDRSSRNYLDNTIAFAELVTPPKATPARPNATPAGRPG